MYLGAAMSRRIRWGVLGVAKIAVEKVIPAMQRGALSEVTAIASRDVEKARAAAARLGIAKPYGSYEALLADPEIDALYNPLPNHLHVPWSIRAAQAGKHVLCEKPIALSVAETRELIRVRDAHRVKIGEAFMARTHPQWLRVKELADSGAIGEVRTIAGFFSYFNRDPQNIRNRPEMGGGALMDIGCYPVTLSRMILGREPLRAMGLLDRDPEMHTDRYTSVLLDYGSAQCSFTCSTQLAPYQRMHVLGTRGRMEVEIPFNAPPDRPTRIFVDDRVEEFAICDQYTIQGDLFSRAILEDTQVPVPLEDAASNMAVIEAIFRSEQSATWEIVGPGF
jgi:predicted dehydrogenase